MTRNALHRLKGLGYSTSSVSVFLLAAVSWDGARKSGVLTACLIAGVMASIVGMFLRWLTYEIEKRKEIQGRRDGAKRAAP
jgi:xanthine/uracil permease